VKLKVFSNLIIVYMSLGKIEEAKDCLEKLITFINNEENENEDINNKLISLKEVLNIFFRLGSLIDVDKYKNDNGCLIKEKENSDSNNYGEIIYKLINTFYLFLHTND
jgi:tetratricopeptide (TPR) repeat protein